MVRIATIANSSVQMVNPEAEDARLRRVWNQAAIPVALRRTGLGEKLRIRLPYARDNKEWLQNERRFVPEWLVDLRCWETPKSWFDDFVDRALERFGSVYIIQPFREQEKCAPACQKATGHECECSCMGANHGAGSNGGWFEVSETFAVRWSEPQLACRLLTKRRSGLRCV